jgi:diguanylate cyclase (GGDEF)-like protein
VFSNGAVLISAVCVIASIFIPAYRLLLIGHTLIFLYSCFLWYFSKKLYQSHNKQIRLYMYLADVPLLVVSLLMGTYLDPHKQAISIVIFLCILPLFIMDKPRRSAAYQICFALAFVGMSYWLKPYEIFLADVNYLPIYLMLSISANYFTLVERVEGVENYVKLQNESEKDALTKLLNRKSGEEKVKILLNQNVHGSFCMLDIDDFKIFNDEYGHQTGDEILRNLSDAVAAVFRNSDVVWRLGGDEFAIFAVNLTDEKICRQRFDALAKKICEMKLPQGVKESVTISVGCYICQGNGLDFEMVYHDADTALYQAKASGRGQIVIQK